jgi:hypothetical protein
VLAHGTLPASTRRPIRRRGRATFADTSTATCGKRSRRRPSCATWEGTRASWS